MQRLVSILRVGMQWLPLYCSLKFCVLVVADFHPSEWLRWSDPETWQQAGFRVATCDDESCTCPPMVPIEGKSVTIPHGARVLLDVDTPVLNGVMIHGELIFEDKPGVGLSAHWVMIMGEGSALRIGSVDTYFVNNTHITLYGTDRSANLFGTAPLHSGNKFIMVMEGGTLAMHGASAQKHSWTQIEGDVFPGDTRLTVAIDSVGWLPGDRIVLAPSGYNPAEAEVLTVTAVDGREIQFQPALQHRRFGRIQTIAGRQVDMRAEIGLLTRNIRVQGAQDSVVEQFGAHVMIMDGFAAIEGVEFTRTGQRGLQGRYSLHWHWHKNLTGERAVGQYVRNSSFHHAFQRAVNIHKTDGVHVVGNVAYHIGNHAYVTSEDGDEEFNVFEDNLGILTIAPSLEHLAFPSGNNQVPSLQNEHRPAVFWGKNPNNTLRGNHAVGGENGFFFDGEFMGTSSDNPSIVPRARVRTEDAIFEDNVAHSNSARTAPFEDNIFYPFFTNGHGIFFRDFTVPNSGNIYMRRFLAYKNSTSGAWLEDPNQIIIDSVMADMQIGVSSDGGAGKVRNSLIVGRTANDVGLHPHNTVGIFGREAFHPGFEIEGNTFVNLASGAIFPQKNGEFNIATKIRNNRVINSRPVGVAGSFAGRLLDQDGTLIGTDQPTYVSRMGYSPDSVPHVHGLYYTTSVEAGSPNGPYFQLDHPAANQLVGHASMNGKVELLYRYANWDLSIPGYYIRTWIDGVEVLGGAYNGNVLESISVLAQQISGTGSHITTHTIRIGLYYYDKPIPGQVVERTFRFSQGPHIEIASPAQNSVHEQPVRLIWDSTALVNVRGLANFILNGSHTLRLMINGIDAGPIVSEDPILFDRLEPGTHTVQIVCCRVADNQVIAADSVTFTTTFQPTPLPEFSAYPPAIAWLDSGGRNVFALWEEIPLRVSAVDDGFISKVDIWVNGTIVRTLLNPPYELSLGGLPLGVYSIHAVATDDLGLTAATVPRLFHVVFPPASLPDDDLIFHLNPAAGISMEEGADPILLDPETLENVQVFTFASWVFLQSGSHEEARIFSKANGVFEGQHEAMLSKTTDYRLRARLKTNGVTQSFVTEQQVVVFDEWIHLVLRYDGEALSIWVNGVKMGTRAQSGLPTFTAAVPFSLGNNPGGARPMVGFLRDFRIYSRALDAKTLEDVMKASSFNLWRAAHFHSSLLSNPSVSGPFATMSDGVPLLLKFASGVNIQDPIGAVVRQEVSMPDGRPVFSFSRNRALNSEALVIEVSSDLMQWTSDPSAYEKLLTPESFTRERVRVMPPAGSSPNSWFVRLRVSLD